MAQDAYVCETHGVRAALTHSVSQPSVVYRPKAPKILEGEACIPQ